MKHEKPRDCGELNAPDPKGEVLTSAGITALPMSERQRCICICQNLTSLSEAFAQVSSREFFEMPAGVRRSAHAALREVWEVLDLVHHLEQSPDEKGSELERALR